MRVALPLALIASSLALAAAQSPSPSPSPAAPPAAPGPPGMMALPENPHAAENEAHLADLRKAIAGREDKPAKEVFKNLKTTLADAPAARLLQAMGSFTRSLGVGCTKCHVADDWDNEKKDEKQTARDMMKMTRAINEDYILKIAAIADDKPSVSCFTCHRGQPKPGAGPRPPRPSPVAP